MSLAHPSTDIAIVGMAALFPGAKDLSTYWQNILNKVSAIQSAPDEWAVPYYDPDAKTNDRIYTRKGGFLGDLAKFNPINFGIMPSSVDGGEPDHFLALKVASDALEDAGYLKRPFDREKAGIILGRGTYINRGFATLLQHGQIVDQTMTLLQQLNPELDPATLDQIRQQLKASLPPFTTEMAPGLVPNVLTGRIANRLDLMGPNYIVDAACASSLIATQLAIQELVSGRCDLILTGGVHASTPPQINMIFCQLGALGPDRIAPFDQSAAGTLLGEGLGIVVLKRLADAERDRDRIYAVLKGIGESSDGKALGLLAPRLEGEVLALQRAYAQSGVDPATVGLVEAHGTGIPLGDRTEVQSLTQMFGQRQSSLPTCALGSVKSMIGHCLPAAGAASLIKVALSLYHKVLPPMLCERINPALEIEKTPFYISTEARPWIHGNAQVPRRAAVNAFGFGGINAHAVLEEYRPETRQVPQWLHQLPSELLIFSNDRWEDLLANIQVIHQRLDPSQISLADLAYTLAKQPIHRCRLAIVAQNIDDLQSKLRHVINKWQTAAPKRLQTRNGIYYNALNSSQNALKTAFLFPGEGSQYQNMLADLCLYFPQVRAWFDFLDATLAERRSSLPSQIIFPPPTGLTPSERHLLDQQIFNMDIGSEAVFTASMALYELLQEFGIQADVMVGHSTGENTALIASGMVRLANKAELIQKIRHLNQIYLDLELAGGIPKGELIAAGAIAPEELHPILHEASGRIHLAMDNCPNQVILFGTPDDLATITPSLKRKGAICTRLPFDRAYHTPLFASVGAAFRSFYEDLNVGPGHTRVYSCCSAAPFPTEASEIRTLAAQQWSSRVRFRETIQRLYEEGVRTFVEVGPSSNLTAFVTDTLAGCDALSIASNSQKRTGLEQLQHLLGRLFVNGYPLHFNPLYQHRNLHLIDLNAPQPPPPPQPVLPLTMPVMRLSPEFLKTCSVQPPSAPLTATPAALPMNGSSAGSAIDNRLESRQVERANESSPMATVPPPIPQPQTSEQPFLTPINPSPQSFKQTLITEHFQLMAAFLENQGRIATALYTHIATAKTTHSSVRSTGTPLPFTEQFPLLGNPLKHDGQQLECERRFELGYDLFLHDHTIGSKPSDRQPDLLALPVIPFTISMEILAEAAVCLVGSNKVVTGMSQLRGYRWLALDQGHLTLRISAQLQPQPDAQTWKVQVRLFQLHTGPYPHLVFEGNVHLAAQFTLPPAPLAFHLSQPASSRWTDAQLYSTGMFHGPRFQGVKHICRWGSEGIEANLQVIAIDNFFQNQSRAVFQTDAGLLDAGGQLIGYWVSEQFGSDFNVFPFQVRAFHQYSEVLPPGSWVRCRGLIELLPDRQAIAQFDFLDEQGRVIARLEGWQDRCFSVPENYYQCRLQPQITYLSEPWLQPETNLIVRRIEPFPEGFLSDSWGIWQRVLAHLILNHNERGVWYGLPEKGPRRIEWLLGRVVAKDAVRQWAARSLNLQLAPADIEIKANSSGQPIVGCTELEALGRVPQISISHSHHYAVAALAPPGIRIGVDLQRLEKLQVEDLQLLVVSEQELQWLENRPTSERHMRVIEFWCAKEAAAKALGQGLGGNPKQWEVCAYFPDQREVHIRYANIVLRVKLWHGEQEVLALCHSSEPVQPTLESVSTL